jgi:hypothetical protein
MGDDDSNEMEGQFKAWSKSFLRVARRIIQQREKVLSS